MSVTVSSQLPTLVVGGRDVDGITYSAYRTMAEKALRRIARELESEDPLVRVAIVHRIGPLRVGDASTAIAVSSPHRETIS